MPSQDGQRSYDVEYGERECCACPDYLYRGGTCIHLYALGIAVAKGAIAHPELAAGDPFVAAGHSRSSGEASEACTCWGGWVFVGHLVLGDDGEEVEVIEAVPCRRCAGDVG